MNKDYYFEYYKLERNHWWFKVRAEILMKHIKNLQLGSNLKILNIGVATGKTSQLLDQFGTVTSLEYDKDCCDFIEKEVGIPVINGSILELPFQADSFDLVCAFDVIEHVEDHLKAVQEMKRVCKPRGIVSVTVPAFMALWGQHDVVNNHYRRYVLPELTTLFNQQEDGKIVFKNYFNFILFLPILSVRFAARLAPSLFQRKGAGSDFTLLKEDAFINKLLYKLFKLEVPVLKRLRLPFGVSILLTWQKH